MQGNHHYTNTPLELGSYEDLRDRAMLSTRPATTRGWNVRWNRASMHKEPSSLINRVLAPTGRCFASQGSLEANLTDQMFSGTDP